MNIERARAKHALDTVEKWKNKDVKKYVSYVKGLPASILQNGLGQAMATLLAASKGNPGIIEDGEDKKVKEAHRLLYDHVEAWLCNADESPSPYTGGLMEAITSGSEPDYILAQTEALAYLNWLKKFAVAYLSKPEDGT